MPFLRRVQSLAVVVLPLVLASCGGGGTGSGDEWTEACAAVDCGPGRCVYDGQGPACLCNEGFGAQGLRCEAEADDPCAPNPCLERGRTRCVAEGQQARCECDEGRVDVNGSCLNAAACNPNPCTAPFQTVCIPQGDTFTCACDPGHEPTDSGCNPISTFDCSVQHTTGNPDAFEPDECPTNAKELVAGGGPVTGHSISPAGDVDWFRIVPEPGHIYEVVVTASASLQLYGDVFDSNAATSLGSDHRGGNRLSMRFKAPGQLPVFARVRALKGTDSGSYTISLFDRGVDDYADTPQTALEFQSGAVFQGAIQFDHDADVFAFALQPGTQHGFSVSSTDGTVSVELLDDAGELILSRQDTSVAFTWRARAKKAFIRVRSTVPGELVGYEVANEYLGPDDHGDSPADATAVTPGPAVLPITLERADDLDVLSFDVIAGNVYAVTCSPAASTSSDGMVALLDEAGTVLASENVYYASEYIAAEAGTTGKLYLRMGWYYSSSNNTTASFGCRVEDIGPEDHGDTWTTATPVTVGMGGYGRIEVAADADVFSFTATAQHVYRFNCALGSSSCGVRFLSAGGAVVSTGSTYEAGPVGGTYFVEVKSDFYSFGPGVTYTYSLDDLGVDDHGDTVFAATAVTVGAPAGSALLESRQDKDVFAFTAEANHIYRFSCSLVGAGANGACALKILGTTGVTIAASDGSSPNGMTTVAWELPTAGTYFVEVALTSYDLDSAWYSFSLVDLGTDDHGDDASTATALSAGTSESGTLEFRGDVDAFSFAATSGHVYRLTCTKGTVTSCGFRLKDAAGAVLTAISGNGSSVSTAWEATANATLTVELGAISSSSYDRPEGTYSWTLTDVGMDDHGDTPSTATAVTLPMTTTQASLESVGDVDAFAFTAVAGHIYRVTCTTGAYPGCDVRVKDPAGVQLSGPFGLDSTMSFLATIAGTWTAEMLAGTSGGSPLGTYSWLVEDLGVDDHGGTPATATAVNVNESVGGSVQYFGDEDVFSFTAVPGHLYQVACVPPQSGGLGSCDVVSLQANGAVIDSDLYALGWKATTATQYVKIRSYSSSSMGAFTLTVTDMGVDDHGDTYQTATAIPAAGSTVSGTLEIAGDTDFFSVSLAAGAHSATVTGSSYVDVAVYGTNGVSQLAVDPSTGAFNVSDLGTYYVRVYGWSSRSPGGPYSLRVQ